MRWRDERDSFSCPDHVNDFLDGGLAKVEADDGYKYDGKIGPERSVVNQWSSCTHSSGSLGLQCTQCTASVDLPCKQPARAKGAVVRRDGTQN
jgi:hypothetical protein